jgi:hypothetical protein
LEDLFQALNVASGLFQMLFEAGPEFFRGRSLGHFRERFQQLTFCVKQIL